MKAVKLLQYGGQLAFDDVHHRSCPGSRRARASDPASGRLSYAGSHEVRGLICR